MDEWGIIGKLSTVASTEDVAGNVTFQCEIQLKFACTKFENGFFSAEHFVNHSWPAKVCKCLLYVGLSLSYTFPNL